MRPMRALAVAALAAGLAVPAGAEAQFGFGRSAPSASDSEKGVLENLISRALSTPTTRVSIGAVEGALSSDATIRDIQISDRDGVWLKLDRARIVWRRLALLSRRLEIDTLEIGTLEVSRKPIPAEAPVAGEDQPLLPQLPVKVEVKAFALGELRLGEPLFGTAARLTATGNARLSNDTSEGLNLVLDGRRLDQPGTLSARLSLVPQGQRLTLAFKVDEAAGGLISRAGNIPGQPPVKLDIDGQGTLDAFGARITFEAGPDIGATGSANLTRQGAGRQLALDLQARIAGLLPAPAAPIFAGTTKLTGNVAFADDGSVALNGIGLAAAAARLDVTGGLRDGNIDVTVSAANVPTAEGRTVASGAEIRRLALQGRVTGPLTGPTIEATLAVEDAKLPAGRLAKLDATFRAAPAGTDPDGATRLTVSADGQATGLAPSDPALARAIGGSTRLTLRGTATTKGVAEIETLQIATPTAQIRYAGRLGSDEIRGRLGLDVANLRPFSDVAGLALAGSATVTADLEGTPRARRYNATLDGKLRQFASGKAALDGLFGGRVGLAGTVRIDPTGAYGFENLQLAGENANARLNGTLAQESADLGVEAHLPYLKRADPRLSGRADLTGRVTGGLQHPNLVAEVALADAAALGRAIPRLALGLDLKDATGALDGTVKLDGTIDGKAARGGFRLTRPAAGGYRLDGLDLAIGSVALKGGVALDPANLASGRVTLNAADLDDLSALLLTQAAGALDADVTLDGAGGRQNARVVASGRNLSAYGATLNRLAADLGLTDLYRRPVLAGEVAIDEVKVAGEEISRVRLDAKGSPEASDITLTAAARGFDLDAAARLVPGDRTRIELSRLTAKRGGQQVQLAGPGTLTIAGGGVEIAGVTLGFGSGRLRIDGKAGSGLDLTVGAQRLPLSAADLARPGLDLGGTLTGEARITGTTARPTGTFRFQASGVTAPQTRVAGLAAIEALLTGRLAGDRVVLDGSTVALGRSAVRVDGSAPLSSAGDLDIALKGQLDAAGLGGLLGPSYRLAGTFDLDTALTGTAARPEARIGLKAERFATGKAAIDGLLGARPSLGGRVFVPAAGGFAADTLVLTGAAVTARIDGPVSPDAADLTVTAEIPDLKRADARLTGRATANVRVTGTLDHPDATVRIGVANATALGRPVPRLALDAVARDILGALDARVTLDGEVDRRPARGSLHVARPAGGGTVLDGLDLRVGSVTAAGAVALDADSFARGRLTVKAPNLDDLSPLLLTRATGTIDADVTLDVVGGGQNARIKAEADRVSVYGLTLSRADADLTVLDLYRRPSANGQVRIDEAAVSGERITKVRLTAQGTQPGRGTSGGSDIALTATARGFDLDARARVVPGDRIRIEISQLGATRGTQRLGLAGPATVTVVPGGVDLRGVALALGTGRLTLEGEAGSEKLDLRANARAVPLSVADLVSPGLGLAGTFNGEAQIAGTPSAPSGTYRLRIDGLAAPQTRSLGLPPTEISASGNLAGGRATIDANVVAGRAGTVRIGGSLPAGGAGNLDLTVRGHIDAGAATTGILAAGGRRLTGRVDLDARVGGTLSAPEASGAATLGGGTFTDSANGLSFSGIRARLVARGQEVAIEGASATARNGGVITAGGRVRLDPAAGFPGEIRIQGQNAELVRSSLVTAVASLNLSLSGPLARDPRVSGRVDLVSAEVGVPENLSGALKPLPNTRHLRPTGTTRARLALDQKAKGKGGRAAPPFDAVLDLTLNAPGQIFVRGRGLDAELGGSLRLTGTLAKPVPNGAFSLKRGTFQVATVSLDFRRGSLTFAGDLTPELDFEANTNAGGAAIQIAVTGPANSPNFAFTSSPSLPQDEVLSRLLFNSPSGQLSPFQALALAQAAAQFSSGGEGAFEGLRRSLGLSGLDVGAGAGGLTAGLQRRFGNRLSVGIKAGGGAGSTGLGIDYRITDEIRLQGEVGATGGSSVGAAYQYEW